MHLHDRFDRRRARRRFAGIVLGLPLVLAVAGTTAGCSPDKADASADYDKITEGVDAFEHSGDRDTLIRRREAAVVQCMQDEFGFTYLPVPPERPSDPSASTPEDETDYGLVDQYLGAAPGEPEVDAAPQTDGAVAPVDPNEAAVAAMSPADADAWRLAAYGIDRDYRDRHPESTDARRVGCVNAASAAVLGPENAALLSELADAEQEIAARTDQDSDLARVVARHAACVADRGFGSATTEFDPAAVLLAEAQRLVPELATQSVDEVAAARGGDTLVADQLRQYERSLFSADQSCRTEVGLTAAREEARTRATESYAAERANRFEAYRAMLVDVRQRAAEATSGGEVNYDFSSPGDGDGGTEVAGGAS